MCIPLVGVILRASDIVVARRKAVHLRRERSLIQMVLQDRLDASVGDALNGEGSLAGHLQPLLGVAFGQGDDAHAGAEPLFGIRPA